MQLILASQSEGRKFLLSQLKIPFAIIHTDLDEEKIVGKTPVETIQLRAKLKAEEAASDLQRSSHKSLKLLKSLTKPFPLTPKPLLILSADTEVIFHNKLLGKPKDYKSAMAMLKMLSGKTHEVVTAVYTILIIPPKSLKSPKKLTNSFFDRSLVTFSEIKDKDIKTYLSLTDYTRYTGGYALIASPHTFITKIEGSVSNVVGLPLEKILPILKENNLI